MLPKYYLILQQKKNILYISYLSHTLARISPIYYLARKLSKTYYYHTLACKLFKYSLFYLKSFVIFLHQLSCRAHLFFLYFKILRCKSLDYCQSCAREKNIRIWQSELIFKFLYFSKGLVIF